MPVIEKLPENIKFEWVPIENSDPTICGRPQPYDVNSGFKGKRVVLVSVPGAFTPGCQGTHVPPFLKRFQELSEKNVDNVVVIAYNDAWVMNAWGKVNNAGQDGKVLFMSDNSKDGFSQSIGWTMGERLARYAMIIEKDGTVSYAGKDKPGEIQESSFETVLAKL